MADLYPDLKDRPLKDTICLFDVDNTLTPARLPISPEMRQTLARLRHKCAIGYVGGSNFPKQQEQIGTDTLSVKEVFDFCFAENGLEAYRLGQPLASTSFLEWIGEERYQKLAKWILRYISDLEGLPAMRGTFIEFRNGMINVSPVGRNASTAERNEFEAWDKKNNCRPKMIQALKDAFPDLAVTYSIGGQISFDVFPTGWDKTYCLRHVEAEADPAKGLSGIKYKNIHFFGDKCFEGGNDWEIYNDKRTIGHSVENPADCLKQIKEIFDL